MLEVWDVTLDRLKPAHLVAGKVLLSAHVPLGGRPAYKAPTVSSRVVRPDLHSFVDLLFVTRLQFWTRGGAVLTAG